MRRRLVALLILLLIIPVGLWISRTLADPLGDILGDGLYATAVYLAAILVWPARGRRFLVVLTALICAAIECFQATGLPAAWAEIFPPIRLVLGGTFSARDLVVYALFAVLCGAIDAWLSRRRAKHAANGMDSAVPDTA